MRSWQEFLSDSFALTSLADHSFLTEKTHIHTRSFPSNHAHPSAIHRRFAHALPLTSIQTFRYIFTRTVRIITFICHFGSEWTTPAR